jgi:flagellar biosynthesis GTPase FlhF
MRVRSFKGRTLEEVLPQVRAELGPAAVVLGQRSVVEGGVGGFFGKRMIEVTAADRMPSDSELVQLEDEMMGGGSSAGEAAREQRRSAPVAPAAAQRSGLDLVDDWDPAADEELAAEYGGVLQRMAAAAARRPEPSYEPLELPRRAASGASDSGAGSGSGPTTPDDAPAGYDMHGRSRSEADRELRAALTDARDRIAPHMEDRRDPNQEQRGTLRLGTSEQREQAAERQTPAYQARELAVRAHEAIAAATHEIERQVASSAARQPGQATNVASIMAATTVREVRDEVLRAQVHEGQMIQGEPVAVNGDDMASAVAARDLPAPDTARDALLMDPPPPPAPRPARPVLHPPTWSGVTATAPAPRRDLPPTAREVHDLLAGAGVDSDVAEALIHQLVIHRLPFVGARDLRDVVRELVTETLRVDTGWPAIGRTHRVAIVGASGSGTSSVVAKLAEGYISTGLSVGVVSIIAGTSRTAIAAQANDPLVRRGTLDVRFAADPEQMIAAMEYHDHCDVVLVDCPSSSYLDAAAYATVARCLGSVRIDDVQAVVPLAVSVREAESVIDHFRPLGVRHLVVSKLDESRYAGQLLNFGFRFGLPITFLTDGPRIPEDIRAASAPEIAALIVPHHQHEGIAQ